MKYFILGVYVIIIGILSNCFSQAILNTETLMKEIDSTFHYSGNVEGDLKLGNINLLQFNTNILVGKKIENHLFRGFINYSYLAENKSILASDVNSQLRYNYFIKKHSFYTFVQLQNSISLRLNKRLLAGIGFRQAFLKKSINKNYIDFAYGAFYEEELYQESNKPSLRIRNLRLNFANYSQVQIGKNNRILNVVYYQINTNDLKDYRVYFEPRFYHDWKKWAMYIKGMYRFHSSPYIDIVNYDADIMLGLEIKL